MPSFRHRLQLRLLRHRLGHLGVALLAVLGERRPLAVLRRAAPAEKPLPARAACLCGRLELADLAGLLREPLLQPMRLRARCVQLGLGTLAGCLGTARRLRALLGTPFELVLMRRQLRHSRVRRLELALRLLQLLRGGAQAVTQRVPLLQEHSDRLARLGHATAAATSTAAAAARAGRAARAAARRALALSSRCGCGRCLVLGGSGGGGLAQLGAQRLQLRLGLHRVLPVLLSRIVRIRRLLLGRREHRRHLPARARLCGVLVLLCGGAHGGARVLEDAHALTRRAELGLEPLHLLDEHRIVLLVLGQC